MLREDYFPLSKSIIYLHASSDISDNLEADSLLLLICLVNFLGLDLNSIFTFYIYY